MATARPKKISDEEIEARAKMASFIDHVVEVIESTPKPEPSLKKSESTSGRERSARP